MHVEREAQFFYVYIIASKSRVIYVGVCRSLQKRVWQHKQHEISGFTKKYNVDRLVYFEKFVLPGTAIAREKEIKGWRREKKVELIKAENPTWEDLAADWYQQ
jgi:putative endonuclease